MLDAQAIIIGTSLQQVTHVVLALKMLLRPFNFCGPVIPILPSFQSFMQLLDSPTPFIIGVAPSPALQKLLFLDTSIFVDLDKATISTATFHVYPREASLVSALHKVISKEKSDVPHPFGYPLVFRKIRNHARCFSPMTDDLIARLIREPLIQLITDAAYGFFVTDLAGAERGKGVTVFNTELFLAQVLPESRDFFEHLVASQNFDLFIRSRITEYLESRGETGRIVNLGPSSSTARLEIQPRRRCRSIDAVPLELLG
jgi:hypothetical protein